MPTIGETLREARMRQRLDIADIEAKTKIRAKYLRALENEEFGMLPGPTFVKTFLRTYAEVLGLDPQMLIDEYRASYERDEIEQLQPLSPGGARDRRRAPGPPGPWLVIGLVVAAVVAALLVIGLVGEDGDGQGEPVSREATKQPRRERPEPSEPQPRPRRVVLRIAPVAQTYVCIDTGEGTDVRFEGILAAPQTFRGRRLRLNLGNTSVEVTMNDRPVSVGSGAEPVGFDFTPGRTTPLPVGQRPCA